MDTDMLKLTGMLDQLWMDGKEFVLQWLVVAELSHQEFVEFAKEEYGFELLQRALTLVIGEILQRCLEASEDRMNDERLELAEVLAIRSCNAEHSDARRLWMLLMENVIRAVEEQDDGPDD